MSDTPRLENAADAGVRVVAYLIDILPVCLIAVLWFVPLVGPMIFGLLAGSYWLLRDIGGASLGKITMGLRVVARDGQESTPGMRIVRNLTLAMPLVGTLIPLAGYLVGPCFVIVLDIAEVIALLATGERIGDRLAGTVVVKK